VVFALAVLYCAAAGALQIVQGDLFFFFFFFFFYLSDLVWFGTYYLCVTPWSAVLVARSGGVVWFIFFFFFLFCFVLC
jgi:hypothetical protein